MIDAALTRGDGSIDPDRSSYDLMAIYGALMMEVQTLELSVAALSLIVGVEPGHASKVSLRRQIGAVYKKGRHAFRRGSLSASRDRLRGKIDDQLFAEIADLLPHRNRLAHRFLVERMTESRGASHFRPGTALEILEYARRFKVIGDRVEKEIWRRAQDLPDEPDEVAAVLDRFARSIVFAGDVVASELRDRESVSAAAPVAQPPAEGNLAEPS